MITPSFFRLITLWVGGISNDFFSWPKDFTWQKEKYLWLSKEPNKGDKDAFEISRAHIFLNASNFRYCTMGKSQLKRFFSLVNIQNVGPRLCSLLITKLAPSLRTLSTLSNYWTNRPAHIPFVKTLRLLLWKVFKMIFFKVFLVFSGIFSSLWKPQNCKFANSWRLLYEIILNFWSWNVMKIFHFA